MYGFLKLPLASAALVGASQVQKHSRRQGVLHQNDFWSVPEETSQKFQKWFFSEMLCESDSNSRFYFASSASHPQVVSGHNDPNYTKKQNDFNICLG